MFFFAGPEIQRFRYSATVRFSASKTRPESLSAMAWAFFLSISFAYR